MEPSVSKFEEVVVHDESQSLEHELHGEVWTCVLFVQLEPAGCGTRSTENPAAASECVMSILCPHLHLANP